MAKLPRPKSIVRVTLSLLGILFMPLSIWFLRDPRHRYLTESAALFISAMLCFYLAFRRNSWLMTALEGLE